MLLLFNPQNFAPPLSLKLIGNARAKLVNLFETAKNFGLNVSGINGTTATSTTTTSPSAAGMVGL